MSHVVTTYTVEYTLAFVRNSTHRWVHTQKLLLSSSRKFANRLETPVFSRKVMMCSSVVVFHPRYYRALKICGSLPFAGAAVRTLAVTQSKHAILAIYARTTAVRTLSLPIQYTLEKTRPTRSTFLAEIFQDILVSLELLIILQVYRSLCYVF